MTDAAAPSNWKKLVWKAAPWVLLAALIVYVWAGLEASTTQKLLATLLAVIVAAGVGWVCKKLRDLNRLTVYNAGATGLVGAVVAVWAVLWSAGFFGTETRKLPTDLRRPISRASLNDPAQRQIFLNFARDNREIHLDSITHGQSDRNILDTLGTRGLIVPAGGIHNLEFKDLGPGQGRIVWRISITGSRGYPYLDVPAGASYVLIDSLVRRDSNHADVRKYLMHARESHGYQEDTEDTEIYGIARALIVPDNLADTVRQRTVLVKRHFGYWWNRPTARWAGPGAHHGWGDCTTHGCCEM